MQLLAHPDSAAGPVRGIDAWAARTRDGYLQLTWRLEAELSRLHIPAATITAGMPARADGLWRHTCFEVFVSAVHSSAYRELNFSPSGEWAAYGFTAYRAGMAPLDLPAPPVARWHRTPAELTLEVVLSIDDLLPGLGSGPLRLALAAVIEDASGTLSYRALRHPPGKADFHHPEAFALELTDTAAA